jgi:Ricin-type beta-trefoil lectin domain
LTSNSLVLRSLMLASLPMVLGNASAKAEFLIRNVASGFVLDVLGGSVDDFKNIILFQENNQQNQLFNFAINGTDESFQLYARHSFKCLDVSYARTEDGVPIVQFPCDPTGQKPNQRWVSIRMGRGHILRAMHSGKCLDVRNGDFPLAPRSGQILNQWTCINSEHDANAVNQIFTLGGH